MRFRRLWLALALACSTLALPACAGSTPIDQVWRAPEWSDSFEHVVVFGMSKREGVRRGFEDGVAATLRRAGVKATPSYELFPADGELFPADVEAALAEHMIDGALVARLVAIDTQERFIETGPYVVTGPGVGLYGYYHSIYAIVHSPTFTVEEQVVAIESNLYDVYSRELVWSGLSATIAPRDVEHAIRPYAKATTRKLLRAGLVRAKSAR